MILDLPRFIATERPAWTELERMLDRIARSPDQRPALEEAKRFHFLYRKVSADLGRIATFAAEPELRAYLESLTARAYGEIHETRSRAGRFRPWHWFSVEFPRAFRRHFRAFVISALITLAGVLFGGFAVAFDEEAKETILPAQFASHLGDPAERVRREESTGRDRLQGHQSTFASQLMANNIGVSIKALALGMTYGIGTIVILFYNGVILGLVALDYIFAGQLVFLLAWLLPHGSIEIPAILLAGQGGLVLGHALIGRGDRAPLAQRLRAVGADLMTLIGGVAVMLVWAGLVESFLSQYHEPVIPYSLKIAFGSLELALLCWFLATRGRREEA